MTTMMGKRNIFKLLISDQCVMAGEGEGSLKIWNIGTENRDVITAISYIFFFYRFGVRHDYLSHVPPITHSVSRARITIYYVIYN